MRVHRSTGAVHVGSARPELNEPGVQFAAGVGRWVTRDHVVACGLLDGDVRIVWDQTIVAEVGGREPFTGDTLWSVYESLGALVPGSDDSAAERALAVGVAIGDALVAHGLDDEELEERVMFLLDNFYANDHLTFRGGLPESEVRALVTTRVSFDPVVAWVGSVPQ